jgi:hypothetical protein
MNLIEALCKAAKAQIECWTLDAKLAWNRFQIFWYS